jgi:glycosyltransferase involved in cell wall biosynthesis
MSAIERSRPKVSVLLVTYNHEKFIAQAVESVLMQKTNFVVELVITDDCSTDQTPFILERFAQKYPETIHLILRESNVGGKRNSLLALKECRGDYVAILEGDDYWIDEYKLQKQVDFFEANPEYVLVGGNALAIDEQEGYKKASLIFSNALESYDFTTADLIERNHLPTLTALFRNRVVEKFPTEYFTSSIGGDRIIYITLSLHGKCRFMNQVFGVYRKHAGGVTDVYRNSVKGQLRRLQDLFAFAVELHSYFDGRFEKETTSARNKAASDIFAVALKSGRLITALRYAQYLDHSVFQKKPVQVFARLAKRLSRLLSLPVEYRTVMTPR